MNQTVRDEETAHDGAEPSESGSSQPKPRWLTVFLVVAMMSILALPRSITASGLGPILIVVSAIVLVLGIFGRD